jgi:hypothetical protein
MKMTPILMTALAVAWLAGCASNSNQVTVDTVGPRPQAAMAEASDSGTLIVYSAFDVGADFYNRNPYGRQYSDYRILTGDGKLYEKVHNNNDTIMQDAVPVNLPAGNYQVKAASNGYGHVTVPIVIAAHQTTILHLEGGGTWQKREAFNDTNTVRLPDGAVIGYRSASSN